MFDCWVTIHRHHKIKPLTTQNHNLFSTISIVKIACAVVLEALFKCLTLCLSTIRYWHVVNVCIYIHVNWPFPSLWVAWRRIPSTAVASAVFCVPSLSPWPQPVGGSEPAPLSDSQETIQEIHTHTHTHIQWHLLVDISKKNLTGKGRDWKVSSSIMKSNLLQRPRDKPSKSQRASSC